MSTKVLKAIIENCRLHLSVGYVGVWEFWSEKCTNATEKNCKDVKPCEICTAKKMFTVLGILQYEHYDVCDCFVNKLY